MDILLEQENRQWKRMEEPNLASVALLLEGLLNSLDSNKKQQRGFFPVESEGIRGKRSEMESDDHLTGDPEERFKKYNRARVLLGKRNF